MSSQLINMISASFVETIIMVLISGGIGAAIGIPLGILEKPGRLDALSCRSSSTLPDRYRSSFCS